VFRKKEVKNMSGCCGMRKPMTDPKVEEKQKEKTQGSQDYSDVEETKQTEVTKCPVCG
jgi:hypothetical protein